MKPCQEFAKKNREPPFPFVCHKGFLVYLW